LLAGCSSILLYIELSLTTTRSAQQAAEPLSAIQREH